MCVDGVASQENSFGQISGVTEIKMSTLTYCYGRRLKHTAGQPNVGVSRSELHGLRENLQCTQTTNRSSCSPAYMA